MANVVPHAAKNESRFWRTLTTLSVVILAVLVFELAGGSPSAVSAQAGTLANLSGVWKTEQGDFFRISQPDGSSSIDSAVVDDKCTGGPRDYFVKGQISSSQDQEATVSGTMQRCSPVDDFLVKNCDLPTLWETPFQAAATRDEISGEYTSEYWIWDEDSQGNVTNCRLDYKFDQSFLFTRVDCGVLTFEELAKKHISDTAQAATEIALARRAEGGETLIWTDNQRAPGGLKEKVERFQQNMKSWGYASRVNSAYRPILYQAHFADLRQCSLHLLHAIIESPELAPVLADSVKKVKAEIQKHGIKSQSYTVEGIEIKVPFVCYREPLTNCPHVDERAVDITFTTVDSALDGLGALYGFCRPYLPDDPPHWEYVGADPWSNPKCGSAGVGPGHADLHITGNSPINLLVQDSAGLRIGYDPLSGEVVNDFGASSAYYSGHGTHPQIIEISAGATVPGSYSVTGVGTGDGDYTVSIHSVSAGYVLDSKRVTGHASSNLPIEPLTYVMLEDYSPKDLWTIGQVLSANADETSFGVAVENQTYEIPVAAEGITSLLFSPAGKAIALKNDGSEGAVGITIPKELMGDKFIVRIDGREVRFTHSKSQANSKLVFEKPPGSQVIVIQHNNELEPERDSLSQVIFAMVAIGICAIVMMASVVAAAAVLVISRRRR